MAVQTTYGVLLPLDVVHSCSDMSTTLMLSDMRFSCSLGSGSLELASDIQAEADSEAQPLLFGSFEEEQEQVCCFTVLQGISAPCVWVLLKVLATLQEWAYDRLLIMLTGALYSSMHPGELAMSCFSCTSSL